MQNISDLLHDYVKDIKLTKEEEEYLCEYIDFIVKNTEPIYTLLDASKKDNRVAEDLIKILNNIVKGNN